MKKIILIVIVMICFPLSVYAGSGCCSHHIAVDESRCTIDGRQVCKDDYISNGDKCTCNPDYYDEEHLVDPKGHDETDPYSYWDSNNYEETNNNSNQSHDITTESEDIETNEIIIDKNIKEGYLAISCTTLIGTLIIYITRIPPKKKSDYQ